LLEFSERLEYEWDLASTLEVGDPKLSLILRLWVWVAGEDMLIFFY
jgi:hypothetical protein